MCQIAELNEPPAKTHNIKSMNEQTLCISRDKNESADWEAEVNCFRECSYFLAILRLPGQSMCIIDDCCFWLRFDSNRPKSFSFSDITRAVFHSVPLSRIFHYCQHYVIAMKNVSLCDTFLIRLTIELMRIRLAVLPPLDVVLETWTVQASACICILVGVCISWQNTKLKISLT